MAGVGTISVNQTAQYGDKTAIDRLKKAATETAMTGNAAPAPTAGRPQGSTTSQPVAQGQPAQSQGVPDDHKTLLTDVAQSYRTFQYWQNVVQQYPSEFSRMYAKQASQAYQQAVIKARTNTPFFS